MCGRFSQALDWSEMVNLYRITMPVTSPVAKPRYNIAPTQRVAVVRPVAQGRELSPLQWGLVPHWAKSRDIGASLINARGETAHEKPSFRDAIRRRRCLVPADGFYEWKTENGAKQPYRISLGNGGGFAFAGLWECWKHGADGLPLETFTIITTAANSLLQPIHHRMPVILDESDHDAWLDTAVPVTVAWALLRPFPAERMTVRRVGTRVNSVAFDDPDCLAEVTAPAVPQQPRQLGLF